MCPGPVAKGRKARRGCRDGVRGVEPVPFLSGQDEPRDRGDSVGVQGADVGGAGVGKVAYSDSDGGIGGTVRPLVRIQHEFLYQIIESMQRLLSDYLHASRHRYHDEGKKTKCPPRALQR